MQAIWRVFGVLGFAACSSTGTTPELGTVTLEARDGSNALAAGVKVVFQNADGSLAALVTTDASGLASAELTAGGTVTAIVAGQETELTSFAEVQPDDYLLLGGGPAPGTFTLPIDVPTNGDDGTPWIYTAYTSCGEARLDQIAAGRASGTLTAATCASPIDLVIVKSQYPGVLVSTITMRGTSVTAGTALSIDQPYVAAAPTTLTLANIPDVTASTGLRYGLFAAEPTLDFGDPFDLQDTTGTASVLVPRLAVPAVEQLMVSEGIVDGTLAHQRDYVIRRFDDLSAAPTTLDLAPLYLPTISSATLMTLTRRIAWNEQPRTVQPDGALARFTAKRGNGTWRWALQAPYRGGVIMVPTLPGDAAMYDPTENDTLTLELIATYRVDGGYATLRPIDLMTRMSQRLELPVALPGSSSPMVYSTYHGG